MKKTIVFFALLFTITLTFAQESKKMKIVENDNGKNIEMELENGNITSLKVNGTTVPKEKYSEYKAVVEKVQAEMKQTPAMQHSETSSTSQVFEQTISTKKDNDNTILTIENNIGEPTQLIIGKDGTIKFKGDVLKDGSKIKMVNDIRIEKKMDGDESDFSTEKIIIQKDNAEKNGKKIEKEVKKKMIIDGEKDLSTMNKMAENNDDWLDDELLNDKIIDKKDNIVFSINDEKMTVNGKTQSKSIFEKYKSIFEKKGVKFNKNTVIEINKSTN